MLRRTWLPLLACLGICGFLLVRVGFGQDNASQRCRVYFGTYTHGASEGIYVSEFDTRTGELGPARLAARSANPSFLALHPNRPLLVAVNELAETEGKPGGAIQAFQVVEASGELKPLNTQSSVGGGPCHLTIDHTGKFVFAANYGGGSVVALPIHSDGELGPHVSFILHEGQSVHPRQRGPHAHCVKVAPDNRFVCVCDLGLDRVLVYRLGDDGKLQPHGVPEAFVAPGAGPRHMVWHPSGRFLFVINELQSSVTVFAYHAETGQLRALQTVRTLPAGFEGASTTAEVQVSPDGRFLYGSNRGHDSLAAFRIDAASGRLEPLAWYPTQGRTPRNFEIDPSGKWLLAANQATDNVVVFGIQEDGTLTDAGQSIQVPAPVCVVFHPRDAG